MYVTTNRQVVCIQPSSSDEIMCAYDKHFGKHSPCAFADFLIGHELFLFQRHCAHSESSVVSQTLKYAAEYRSLWIATIGNLPPA
jgi:hypothetical protein